MANVIRHNNLKIVYTRCNEIQLLALSRLAVATGHTHGNKIYNFYNGGLTGLDIPKETIESILNGYRNNGEDGLRYQLIGWNLKLSGSFSLFVLNGEPQKVAFINPLHQAKYTKWMQNYSDEIVSDNLEGHGS